MIPIYQTIISNINGNCMQASIASMFEVKLNEVPNFIEFGDDWYRELCDFFYINGYLVKNRTINLKGMCVKKAYKTISKCKTINSAIYAVVSSSMFPCSDHAVLINDRGVVIHDPNPNKHYTNVDVVNSGDIKYIYSPKMKESQHD